MSITIKQAIWWQAAAYSPATSAEDFDPENPNNGMSSLEIEPPTPGQPDPGYYTSPTANIVAGKFCGSLRQFSLQVSDSDGDGAVDTVNDSATLGVRFGDPTLADARVVFKPSAAEAVRIFGSPQPVVAIADFANVRVPLSYMLMGVYNSGLSQECSDRSLPDSWFKHSDIPGDLVDPVSLELLRQEMEPRVQTTSDGEDAGFFVKFPRQDDVTQIGCCGVVVEPPGSSTTSSTGNCTTGATLRAYQGTPEKTRIWALRAAVRGSIDANLPPISASWRFTGPNPQELVYAEFDDETLLDTSIDTAVITWHHAGFVVLEDNHGAFFPNDFCGGSANDSINLGNSYDYQKNLPVDIVDIAWDDRGWLWGLCTGPSRTEGVDLSLAPETTVDGLYRILPGGWSYVRADAISFGGHLNISETPVTSRLVESRMGGGKDGFLKVACGDGYTMYLTRDGKVEFISSTSSPANTPPADILSPDATVMDIAASATHAACIMADGKLRVWTMDGTTGDWLLGNDSTGFTKVACGNGLTCAIKNDGDIQVWPETVPAPTRTDPTKPFVALDCGAAHVAGQTVDGDLFVAGSYPDGSATLSVVGVSAFACGSDCTIYSQSSAPAAIVYAGLDSGDLSSPPDTSGQEVEFLAAGEVHAVALCKNPGTTNGYSAWTWGFSSTTLTGVPLTYGNSPLTLDGQQEVFWSGSCGKRHTCLLTNGSLLEPRYSPARLIYRAKVSLGSGVTVDDEPVAVAKFSSDTGEGIGQPQRCDGSTVILGSSDYSDNPFDFTERVGLKIYDPSERTIRVLAARWRPHRLATGVSDAHQLNCTASVEQSSSHRIIPPSAILSEESIPADVMNLKVLERPDTLGTLSFEDSLPSADFTVVNNRVIAGNFGNMPVRVPSVTTTTNSTIFTSGASGQLFSYSSAPVGDSLPFLAGNDFLHTVTAHMLVRYENQDFDPNGVDWAQVPSLVGFKTAFEFGSEISISNYTGTSVGREFLHPPDAAAEPWPEMKRMTSEWRLRCAIPEGEMTVAGGGAVFSMLLPATVSDDSDSSGANFSSRLAEASVGGENLLASQLPGSGSTRFIGFEDFLLAFMSNDSTGSLPWTWQNDAGTFISMQPYGGNAGQNYAFFSLLHSARGSLGSSWRVINHIDAHLPTASTAQKRVLGCGLLHRWTVGQEDRMRGAAVVSSGAAGSTAPHSIQIVPFTYAKSPTTGNWAWVPPPSEPGSLLASKLQVFSSNIGAGDPIDVTTVNQQIVQSERHIVVGNFGIIMQNRQVISGNNWNRCMYFPRVSATSIEDDNSLTLNPFGTGTWVGSGTTASLRPFVATPSDSVENLVVLDRDRVINNNTRDVVWFYGQGGLLSRNESNFITTYGRAAGSTLPALPAADGGRVVLATTAAAAQDTMVLGCGFSQRGNSASRAVIIVNDRILFKDRNAQAWTTRTINAAQTPFWPTVSTTGSADSDLPPRSQTAVLHSQDGQSLLLLMGDTAAAAGTGQPRSIRVWRVVTDGVETDPPMDYLGVLVFATGTGGDPFSWNGETLHTTVDGRLAVGVADRFQLFDIVYNRSTSSSADPAEVKSVRAVHYYPTPSRESINEDAVTASTLGSPLLYYPPNGTQARRQYPTGTTNLLQSTSGEGIGTWAVTKPVAAETVKFLENAGSGLRIYSGTAIVAKIANAQVASRRPGSPSLTSGGIYFSGQVMPLQAPWGNMWTRMSVGNRYQGVTAQSVLFVGDYFGFFDRNLNTLSALSRHQMSEDFIWVTEFNARRALVSRLAGQTFVRALRQERAVPGGLPYTRVREKYRVDSNLYYPLGSGTTIRVGTADPQTDDLWVYWGRKIFKINTQSTQPTIVDDFDLSSISGMNLDRWYHSPGADGVEGYSDYLDGYVTSAAGKNILLVANSRCRYSSIEATSPDPGRMEIAILGWQGSTWGLTGSIILNSNSIPATDQGVKFHPHSYLPQRLSVAISDDGLVVCVAGHVWDVDDQKLPRNKLISIFAKKKTGYVYQTSIPNPAIGTIGNFASRLEIKFEGGGKYRLHAYSPLDLAVEPDVTVDLNSEYAPSNTVRTYLIDVQGVVASVMECNDLLAAGDANFDNSAAANLNHWVASPSPAFDGVQSSTWAGNLLAITTLNRLMMLKTDRYNWQVSGHVDRPYLFSEVEVLQKNFSDYKNSFTCSDPGCATSTGTVKLPSPANGGQALDGRVRASFFVPNATTQPNQQGFYQIDNSAGTDTGWFTGVNLDTQLEPFSHLKLARAIADTAKPSPGEPLFDPGVQGGIRAVTLSGTGAGGMTTVLGNSPCTVRRPLFSTDAAGTGQIFWPFTSALKIEPRYLLRSDEPTTLRAAGLSGVDWPDAGVVALTRNAQNIIVLKDGMDKDSTGATVAVITPNVWAAQSVRVEDAGQLVCIRVDSGGITVRSHTTTSIFPESGSSRVATNSQRFGIKRPAAITVGGASACGAGAFDVARPSRSPFATFEGRAGGSGASPWLLVIERHGLDSQYFSYATGDFGARTLSIADTGQIAHADPFSVDPQAPFDPIGFKSRLGWCSGRAYPVGGNSETVADSLLRMLRGVFDPATGAVFNSDLISMATADALVGDAPPTAYTWSFPSPTGGTFTTQKCVCQSTPLEAFEWLRKVTRRPYTSSSAECALRVIHGAGNDPSAAAPFYGRFQEGANPVKSLIFVLTCNQTDGDGSVSGTPMGSLDENTLRTWAVSIMTNLTSSGIFGAQSSVHFVDMVKRNTGSPYRRACEMLAEVSGGSYISLGRPWPPPAAAT